MTKSKSIVQALVLSGFLFLVASAWAGEVIKGGPTWSGAGGGGHADGTNCPAGQFAAGTDGDGNAQDCTDVIVPSEIDTAAEINALTTDVDFVQTSQVFNYTVSATQNPTEASATCSTGDQFFEVDAYLLYICTATDTWGAGK